MTLLDHALHLLGGMRAGLPTTGSDVPFGRRGNRDRRGRRG
jgi:hypothetical protein